MLVLVSHPLNKVSRVLSACDHCGLVEEGINLFHTMKHEYAINTGIEHYFYMVDLFARAGCFGEAIYLIEEMPFQDDANMWLLVLRGCISYGNKIIGKMATEKIIQLDLENSCAHIQLSNIIATSVDWEGSTKVRELMRDKKCSENYWLQLGRLLNEKLFSSGKRLMKAMRITLQ
ncbi:hypothetical protein RYX36_034468 [Vicia faba]